ncbi:MAG: tRNA epoxyqueuosine(34) reductase QueG [Magnetococcales bacterium]|nr:tRNA epoxyqueuosine(34) reductase QueG [Magnetococcales bacterium]
MINPWEELKEALRAQALAMGFDAAGFAPPVPPPHGEHLHTWLAQGCHGEMGWIARHPERRIDPATVLAGVGVILVLGVNHRPPVRPDGIAAYACHADYHALLKKRVQELGCWLAEKVGRPVASRVCVDTAPVLEKPLAASSGVGWQGKNALLVSRRFGCWLLLAELFIALPLPPDPPSDDHCARCDRCLRACPTDALNTPYRMDASRCLAFFTVESKGAIPMAYREAMGNRVFGCDACVAACPWNRFAPVTGEAAFWPREALSVLNLAEWSTLDGDGFATLFAGTPVKRLGVIRLLRNVAVALGNGESRAASAPLARLLCHEAPLVRSHAAWGLGNLAARDPGVRTFAAGTLQSRAREERDGMVLDEIRLAYARTFTLLERP